MQAENVSHGDAHHSERIIVTQILLDGKRQFYDVINTFDVLGAYSVFIKPFLVER